MATKSKIVGDAPCPQCREAGRDSTGNHLMLFEDGGGYCNRCGYTGPPDGDVTQEEPMTHNVSKVSVEDINGFPYRAIPERGISEATCRKYGVHVGVSETNGEVDSHYYPIVQEGNVVAYKVRKLPKTFTKYGKSTKGEPVELFGQNVVPKSGKKILITGGELDAMCAHDMIKEAYPKSNPIVVSMPMGENIKALGDNLEFVNNYNEVIIYMDMDKVGRETAGKMAELIGPKARIMTTTEKDACDMWKAKKQKEFIQAFYNATPYQPDGFVTVDDVYEAATRMPEMGRSWPWESLTKLTYGRRDGEGAYFGAGVKIGKSEAVNEIVHHITEHEGGKVAIFKLEEEPSMTVRKLAGKIMKKPFHKPDGDFTQAELKTGVDRVKDSGVVLFNSYGRTEWDRLKPAIRHAVLVEGCKDIIIDPLTRLTAGMDASEANTELERVADEIAKMAKDLGFFYMFFCHLKAPQAGKPHEEGGRVHSYQFTGSRAMMRACYYMIGIQRDKSPELPDLVKNMSTFVLLEDRAFGNSGSFVVHYDKDTGDYLEPDEELLEQYKALIGDD